MKLNKKSFTATAVIFALQVLSRVGMAHAADFCKCYMSSNEGGAGTVTLPAVSGHCDYWEDSKSSDYPQFPGSNFYIGACSEGSYPKSGSGPVAAKS